MSTETIITGDGGSCGLRPAKPTTGVSNPWPRLWPAPIKWWKIKEVVRIKEWLRALALALALGAVPFAQAADPFQPNGKVDVTNVEAIEGYQTATVGDQVPAGVNVPDDVMEAFLNRPLSQEVWKESSL